MQKDACLKFIAKVWYVIIQYEQTFLKLHLPIDFINHFSESPKSQALSPLPHSDVQQSSVALLKHTKEETISSPPPQSRKLKLSSSIKVGSKSDRILLSLALLYYSSASDKSMRSECSSPDNKKGCNQISATTKIQSYSTSKIWLCKFCNQHKSSLSRHVSGVWARSHHGHLASHLYVCIHS